MSTEFIQLAGKGGVGAIGESPELWIIEVLAGRGGIVTYHHEYVPSRCPAVRLRLRRGQGDRHQPPAPS